MTLPSQPPATLVPVSEIENGESEAGVDKQVRD